MNAKTGKGRAAVRKKRGGWVLRVGAPLKPSVVDKTIQKVRKEREREVSGGKQ